jgi:hypothetical protein
MAIGVAKRFRLWILIGACGLIFSSVLSAQNRYCPQPNLDTSISGNEWRSGNIIEVLWQVGKSTGTCFGIDVRDQGFLKDHFDAQGNVSLRKLLTQFGPAVTYSAENNFVYVRVGNGAKDWLDVVMPSFQSAEAPPEIVSSDLFTWLSAQTNPRSGTIGSVSFSEKAERVRAFEIKNATVRAALTAIVTNTVGGGMWFTAEQHPANEALPTQRFWIILLYAEPTELSEFRLHRALTP